MFFSRFQTAAASSIGTTFGVWTGQTFCGGAGGKGWTGEGRGSKLRWVGTFSCGGVVMVVAVVVLALARVLPLSLVGI